MLNSECKNLPQCHAGESFSSPARRMNLVLRDWLDPLQFAHQHTLKQMMQSSSFHRGPFSQLAARSKSCVLTFQAPLTLSRRSGWGNKLTEMQMDTPKVSWIMDYPTSGPLFVNLQKSVLTLETMSISICCLRYIKPPEKRESCYHLKKRWENTIKTKKMGEKMKDEGFGDFLLNCCIVISSHFSS